MARDPQDSARRPLATPSEVASEPPAFPKQTPDAPCETAYADWRERLLANLSRRSDGRWDPLTRTHAPPPERAAD